MCKIIICLIEINMVINDMIYKLNIRQQYFNIKEAMIKIKTETNPKLLKNFSNEAFPDITIITATSKYNLTLAYLSIDSELFNQLQPSVTEIDLRHLPQKPLVQILRSLYGDQLTAYSISQLQALYKVIEELRIDEYKEAIVNEIKHSKDLLENLEILEFCVRHNLMVSEIKKIHIDSNLKALESNRNFLQLNKISLNTLIPLLLQYYQVAEEAGASVINNILENYFNRNNIRPIDFFEKQDDVDVLLAIWQQFHHILHIQRKQPTQSMQAQNLEQIEEKTLQNTINISKTINTTSPLMHRTPEQIAKLKQKDAKIAQLFFQIDIQNKTIEKLKKELFTIRNQNGGKMAKRMPSNPILPIDDDDEISILQPIKGPSKKQLTLKNIKSQYVHNNQTQKSQTQTPNRYILSHKYKMY